MQHADLQINPQWLIPVEPAGVELTQHAVIVNNGRIAEVCPLAQAAAYAPAHIVDLPGHALIPGLVNAHGHAAMTLMRGIADDLPLMTWLSEHIWPVESALVSEQFVADGTQLAVAEMLSSGTTCFNDMYFFPMQAARAASGAGMRAVIGMIALDFPSVLAKDADEYIAKGIEFHDHARSDPLITSAWAPHAPYTISDRPLSRIRVLAEEMDVPIHMHVHETADEVNNAVNERGQRPIARLQDLELLSPRLIAVHMTQLEPEEIELVARYGVHVVHCPESNFKLASGACPTDALLKAGGSVALGTDGAASNNDLDMLSEMRSAAFLAKHVTGEAGAVPASSALGMATLGGAKALGLGDEIGSIEPGKAADLCAIDLGDLATQPVYSATSAIVYAAHRAQVKAVWVAGRQVVADGSLLHMDTQRLIANAKAWHEKTAAL
ncbi:MAG: TRZ/ATZ family hydrolase [Gammaproteobacteria bacterium]|nr:TRZ/ATZ family hydrolase [Gammaproteobacteria bacterium]